MKNKKIPLVISLLIALLILITIQLTQQLSLLTISNAFFLVSLPFILIGLLLWVFSSGFFDTFQRSMHHSFDRKRKKPSTFLPLSQVGYQAAPFWLLIGVPLLALSLITTAIYSF